ncbi:transcription factor DICHOTOMA-like [Punica granatum]|uniref:TCP domain-containing protein n=2 Tax=Punica granatum TaxID=22663 RepID=A0A218VVN0_PUNGR|nr:transcription factor DICHOTOMA-like [Punica granatum]OWM64446.1 hypothetical protein CDL15_Pgr020413 [Punica granatum]PKI75607.1 hypothetical protein CRG98_004008 [Punica granatum]
MFAPNDNNSSSNINNWPVKLSPNLQPFVPPPSSSSPPACSSHPFPPFSYNHQDPLTHDHQFLLLNHETLSNNNYMGPFHENSPNFAIFSSSSFPPPPNAAQAAKKDRHSKICTAQGVRDRRVRLSIGIAREFFDLQDMLGFDKASQTLEWLLTKSKRAIKEAARAKEQQTGRAGAAAYPAGSEKEAAADDSKGSSSDLTISKEEMPQEEVLNNIHELIRGKDEDSWANARARDRGRAKREKTYCCVSPNSNGVVVHHHQSIRDHSNSSSSSQLVKPSQYHLYSSLAPPNSNGVVLHHHQSIRDHSNSSSSSQLVKPSQHHLYSSLAPPGGDDLPPLNTEDSKKNDFSLPAQNWDINYNSMVLQPSSFGEPYI